MDKTNYRLISVLLCLSKILEKVIFEQMADYFEPVFSPYLSGFRKRYGCQHVLTRMTENWRKSLDHKKVIGALSMDLSKAFDSLQHDILIAKLHAYGFEMKALKLIYSYMINKTQIVKAKGEYSARCQVKAGVPQGSLLGVLLFNVYLNDLFDLVQADLYNFADDNNPPTVGNTIDETKAILITEINAAINWIESNEMIANPQKFHLMFLSANENYLINQQTINIKGISLKSEANFTLLGVDIDNCLSFHGHINNLCRKAASQINALKRHIKKIYRTLYSLNPSYIREIFKENSTGRRQLRSNYNLRCNTVTFARNSLRILGPKIWNHLPQKFTTAEDLKTLKILLKQWNGPQCNCNLCKYSN